MPPLTPQYRVANRNLCCRLLPSAWDLRSRELSPRATEIGQAGSLLAANRAHTSGHRYIYRESGVGLDLCKSVLAELFVHCSDAVPQEDVTLIAVRAVDAGGQAEESRT